MFLRTTSVTGTFLLILLIFVEGLLTLLLEVGIMLDTGLPLGLVRVEVLQYHVGDRSPFGPLDPASEEDVAR